MDLIDAVITNNKDGVLELLKKNADVHYCEDVEKITPLHHAVSASKIEIIFFLLEFGADPHAETLDEGETPLQLAINSRRFDVISLFLNFKKSCLFH